MDSAPTGTKFEDYVQAGKVFIFSKSYCPYCDRAKKDLKNLKVAYTAVECDEVSVPKTVIDQAQKKSGIKTYPNIWVGTKSIGGSDNLRAAMSSGKLYELLDQEGISYSV
mmetsp:Transcript_70857/g.82524  ORF Transcript_70857/g.82524 Transcript_70857/m.82524 type:complete len:110 (-) Transcript_70857:107-436(-)|eukprot:CAMPEP_0176447402 /NCGR_PEP_ID=MMETSP0127-20121128/25002_1 /TAXON_ID=938130 /ORGANISM="Platyophrya macrostoma, Strain WH" /LENGTH=109 /DNA_ID=CAMNT_0017833825 /DNA_START=29 /DNA_END=358 /DNA_ORIENTATION=-